MSDEFVFPSKGVRGYGGGAPPPSACAFRSSGSYVSRPKLVHRVVGALGRSGLCAMCAEPGMGSHTLAQETGDFLRASGWRIYRTCLSRGSVESHCRQLRRLSQRVQTPAFQDRPSLILIDGVRLDERSIERHARGISSCHAYGCHLLLLLRPEDSHFLSYLPRCPVFGSGDLRVTEEELPAWASCYDGFPHCFVETSTHGMPSLISALEGCSFREGKPRGASWDAMVASVLRDAFRPSLILEELYLRAGMALLGSGGVEDLESLGIRASRDLMFELAHSAPLFGIDSEKRSFSLIGCRESLLLDALASSSLPPSFLHAVVRHLADKGEFARAGTLAGLAGSSKLVDEMVLSYPIELIDAGHTALVSSFVGRRFARNEGDAPAGPHLRRDGFSALLSAMARRDGGEDVSTSFEGAVVAYASANDLDGVKIESCLAMASERPVTRLHFKLLLGCELVLRRCPSDAKSQDGWLVRVCAEGEGSEDRIARTLSAHLRSLSLVMGGDCLGAYRRLLTSRDLRLAGTISRSVFSALLQSDFHALGMLVDDHDEAGENDAAWQGEGSTAAYGMASVFGGSRLLHELASALVRSRSLDTRCDGLIHDAERRGDFELVSRARLIRALEGLATGAYRHAHLHAEASVDAARACDNPGLATLGTMVDLLAYEGLGEASAARARLAASPAGSTGDDGTAAADVVALEDIIRSIVLKGGDPEGQKVAPRIIPRVELVAFADYISGLSLRSSKALKDALPPIWLKRRPAEDQLRTCGSAVAPARTGSVGATDLLSSPDSGQGVVSDSLHRLEIRVLGGMGARVDGVILAEGLWRRKQARTLLAMLALTPGHAMNRGEVIERRWPEADYARGRVSLYTVLSSLRLSLGQRDDTSKFIGGEVGRIWLDDSLVHCDIDEFERMARAAASPKSSDDERVSLCLRMEAMYGDGSYVPSRDSSGLFRRRHEEVARRFVDSMLSGSEAAMRMRDVRQATWFAESASVVAARSEVLRDSLAKALKMRSEATASS